MKFLVYGLSAFLFLVMLGCAKTGENSKHMSVSTIFEGIKKGKLVVNEEHDEIRPASSMDGTPKSLAGTPNSMDGIAAGPDLSGTYKGPDGTLVIKRVYDAHLMKTPLLHGYSETVAVSSSRVGAAKKKNYTDTGAIAPNAYLVTSTLKNCPIKISHIAMMDTDGDFSSADLDGPTYRILNRGNGSLELDFPMSMVRGRGGNCMIIEPFVKMAK